MSNMLKLIYLILLIIFFKRSKKVTKLTRLPEDIFFFNKTIIESHRGMNKMVFQNTIESFKKALEYNMESLEVDVWLTKDNVAVIHHGYGDFGNIEGIYDHPGNITNLTWKELSSYKTIEQKLSMPLLRDTMKLIKNKMFLNLEIKDPRIDIVFPYIIELIEEFDFFSQIYLSSFYHGYYEKIQEYNKNNNRNLIFGFLYDKYKQNDFDYSKNGNILNIYWADATKSVCDKAHLNNMAVLVWFEMEDKETIQIYRQLMENEVDIICSNDPLFAKKYLNYYKRFLM